MIIIDMLIDMVELTDLIYSLTFITKIWNNIHKDMEQYTQRYGTIYTKIWNNIHKDM